jgi:RimJ/RimL family protein N-acetyltransferase
MKIDTVALSPVLDADLPDLFRWINDREQVLLNAPYRPVFEANHREWFENIRHRADVVVFGIRRVDPPSLIGVCQLHSIHAIHRTAELQIRIGEPSARGRGYGTEAVRRLVEFGFKDLDLQRIALHVFADNLAGIRVYEKSGFVREGLLRRGAYIDGTYKDVVIMAVLKD